jgi:hypothetical protein
LISPLLMGLMLLWNLALRLMGAPIVEDVPLISTGNAPISWRPLAVVTIPVLFSKLINIAAILETVHLQIFPDFSKLDAQMLIVTPRMTQQA